MRLIHVLVGIKLKKHWENFSFERRMPYLMIVIAGREAIRRVLSEIVLARPVDLKFDYYHTSK